MSARPTRVKSANRMRKSFRATPKTYIDLIDWLKTRGHAQTTGQAKQILLDGRVKSESHVLGREKTLMPVELTIAQRVAGVTPKMEERFVVAPLVDARLRSTLRVAEA